MKENKKEQNVPISLIIEQAKREYSKAINEVTDKYGIPPYFIWAIFKDFMLEIEFNKEKQIAEEMKILEENKKEDDK